MNGLPAPATHPPALVEQQIATARLEQAQKDNDELQQGPDPDKLALTDKRIKTAQGRIAAADTALAAAQEALAVLKHLQVQTIDLDAIPEGLLPRMSVDSDLRSVHNPTWQ